MISIYARPMYWDKGYTNEKYLHRLTTRVRGEEITEYLGGKFNILRKRSDVCIFVKPRHLRSTKDGDYVDILDEVALIPLLKERPKIKVIAMSDIHFNYLKKELPNQVVLIPHHHINFEKQTRTKNKKIVGGMIGSPSKVAYDLVKAIRSKLKGIEFTTCFNAKTREEMVEYYKSIDFLVIFNLNSKDRTLFYRHPTKIINAASFGIPSLAQTELGYKEVEGLYIPVETVEDIVREAKKLQDEDYYNQWSEKLLKEAEKYHISKIAKLYQNL